MAEFGEFLHDVTVSAAGERNKCGRHRAVEAPLHYTVAMK